MKKTKIFLIILLSILLLPLMTNAQTDYEDVVYLKNGSVIRGTIILEQNPSGEIIKIQTKDRNIFVFKTDEVLKITRESIPDSEVTTKSSVNPDIKKKGYVNITELYFSPFYRYRYNIGIQTVNGYQFNRIISMGLGIGVDRYVIKYDSPYKYVKITFLPLFADVRINFLRRRVTPFFDAVVGYSMVIWSDDYYHEYKGGLLLNPSLGIKVLVTNKTALNFSFGARDQRYYSLVTFKLGVTF